MNIDTKYIKALVFASALVLGVVIFRPSPPKVETTAEVPPAQQVPPAQSAVVPSGDLSNNYLTNALNAKGEMVRWQRMPVSVNIQENLYKSTVETAFNNYNNSFAGFISFSFVDNPASAQIKVNFTDRLENRDSNQFIAGLTNNFTSGKYIQSSVISILTSKNGQSLPVNSVYNTTLHEIGHALGIIGHSQNSADIMYSHSSAITPMSFSQRDLATIKIMYSNNDMLIGQNSANAGSQKLTEALGYAQKAPDKTVSWVNLGNVYYDLKMLPEALEAYKKALSIDATDANIYGSMAACYYESKKFSTAATFYGYALERTNDPVAVENYEYMKALSYLSGQNLESAYNDYKNLISKYPNKKQYMENYIYICAKMNKPEGKEVLISYLQAHPEANGDANINQYKKFYGIR